jgi:hypothetical protein
MSDSQHSADIEFVAMQTLYNALKPLDEDARRRVLNYIVARLRISAQGPGNLENLPLIADGDNGDPAAVREQTRTTIYGTLAELFDVTQPKSNPDKALIAAYWVQVCQGAESFDSQSANTELKHLGYGVPNITAALSGLKNQKPALILQLRKSGKSQQARKTYKLSDAGVKRVHEMTN